MKTGTSTAGTLKGIKNNRVEKPEDQPPKEEIQDLLRLLGWARDKVRRVRERELTRYGLNPDKGAVLIVIQNLGGSARTDDIARQIIRERHSVHELLRRMEKSGLLREIEGEHRKNGIRFELTEKGRAAYRLVVKRPLQLRIFSVLPRKERQRLRDSLYALYSEACEALGEKSLPLSSTFVRKKR